MIDVCFPVVGRGLPADHGYLLFSAVCEVVPRMSHEPGWALHTVEGREDGPRRIRLDASATMRLRLPGRELGEALALGGRELLVGDDSIRLGPPQVCPLKPDAELRSVAVVIPGASEHGIEAAVRRELADLDLEQDPASVAILVGRQVMLRARVRTVLAWPVTLAGLRASASIAVLSRGIGVRRYMGAGVFLPVC